MILPKSSQNPLKVPYKAGNLENAQLSWKLNIITIIDMAEEKRKSCKHNTGNRDITDYKPEYNETECLFERMIGYTCRQVIWELVKVIPLNWNRKKGRRYGDYLFD